MMSSVQSRRPQLPIAHPARLDLESPVYRGKPPGSLRGRFIQRDDEGFYRIVTINGLGEILHVTEPLDSTDIVNKRMKNRGMRPVQNYWAEYDSAKRRRYLIFGASWDRINWWEVDDSVDDT